MSFYSISKTGGPSAINGNLISYGASRNFQLDARYKIKSQFNQGANKKIFLATDTKTNKKVAIRVYYGPFTKRVLRDLKYQRLLKHENLTNLHWLQLPKSADEFEQIVAISELMDTDLCWLIRSRQNLSDQHCQFFLYQMLRGIKYIHSAGVIHGCLRPKCLLVNRICDLRISGFTFSMTNIDRSLTDADIQYSATNWYLAPELIYREHNYTKAIDIWAIGCIFAELLTRRPLITGNLRSEILQRMFKVVGTPYKEDLQLISDEALRNWAMEQPQWESDLDNIFKDCNPQAVDLLQKMLEFNPHKRITAEQCLRHPYLLILHDNEDEPVRDPISPFDFQFEMQNLSEPEVKNLIYEEILLTHFPERNEQHQQRLCEFNAAIV